MFKHLLLSSIRGLFRYRITFFVNVFCLSFACGIAFFAYLILSHELSFDTFNRNINRLYRVQIIGLGEARADESSFFSRFQKAKSSTNVLLPPDLLPEVQLNIPGVTNYCRIRTDQEKTLQYNDQKFIQSSILVSDETFFDMFTFDFIAGSTFSKKNSSREVVIAESFARRVFGEKDAIGQILQIQASGNEFIPFVVIGIVRDPPSNSSFNFSMVVPYSAIYPDTDEITRTLTNLSTIGIIEISDQMALNRINETLRMFSHRYYENYMSTNNLSPSNFYVELASLRNSHLAGIPFGWPKSGNVVDLVTLTILALVILVVASVNYAMVQVTRVASRFRELGIRKLYGSRNLDVFTQLMLETAIVVIFSVIFGVSLVSTTQFAWNPLLTNFLDLNRIDIGSLAVAALLLIVFICFIIGIYPALFMSRFKTIKLIASGTTFKISPRSLHIMVGIQYVICFIFLVLILTIQRQINFIENKDLGFDASNIYSIDLFQNQIEEKDFKTTLERLRSISQDDLGVELVSGGYSITDPGVSFVNIDGQEYPVYEFNGDENFSELFKFYLIDGRVLTHFDTINPGGVLINRSLQKLLLSRCDLNSKCDILGGATIVGIVEDFNFESLTRLAGPTVIKLNTDYITTISLKFQPNQIEQTLARIEAAWKSLFDGQPLIIQSLEQRLQKQYESYKRWEFVILACTVAAILICFFGLFGLAGINAVNSRREIAIRKILGCKDFALAFRNLNPILKISSITFLIGFPIGLYVSSLWLESFAYRISIDYSILAISWACGVFIGLLGASYHMLALLKSSPIEVIRSS